MEFGPTHIFTQICAPGSGPLSWPAPWSPDLPYFTCASYENEVYGPSLGLYFGALARPDLPSWCHCFFCYGWCFYTGWHKKADMTPNGIEEEELSWYIYLWFDLKVTQGHQKWHNSILHAALWCTCFLMPEINGSRNIKPFLLQTYFCRYYLMIYMFFLQFLHFYTVCFIVQWMLWYLLLFLAICWRCSSVAICVSAESLCATHSSRCWCGYFDWIRYFSHVSSPSLSFFLLSTGHYAVEHTVADSWAMLFSCLFIADQCKATGMKTRLDKVKVVASALYSVIMVLWKETAFPLWRAMKSWKRNVVSLLSFSYCVSSSFLFSLIFFRLVYCLRLQLAITVQLCTM